MKKWRKTIGIAVLCLLVMVLALSSCSATHKFVFNGNIKGLHWEEYELGNLHKGGGVRVVITELRGNAGLAVQLTRVNPHDARETLDGVTHIFTSSAGYRFTVPADGRYILVVDSTTPLNKGTDVYYDGYVEC